MQILRTVTILAILLFIPVRWCLGQDLVLPKYSGDPATLSYKIHTNKTADGKTFLRLSLSTSYFSDVSLRKALKSLWKQEAGKLCPNGKFKGWPVIDRPVAACEGYDREANIRTSECAFIDSVSAVTTCRVGG